jgi:hypothetical protein
LEGRPWKASALLGLVGIIGSCSQMCVVV